MLICRCSQRRPDHCNVDSVVNGIICMNWGSRSKSTSYMSWWSSRSSKGLYWSYTVGKSLYKGNIENQEIRKVGLSETHASGNREASTHNDWWKANWWNTYHQERSRLTWNDEVWAFLQGSEPRRRSEYIFFVEMVMEWWMFFFFKRIFLTEFFQVRTHVVATIVCTTGCVHTRTCCTHIFLHIARAQSHPHIFMRVTYTHDSSSWKRCLSHECLCSPSRLHPSHVSPIFCCLLSLDFPVHTFLPYSPVLKAQDMRISARGRELWLSGQFRSQHRFGIRFSCGFWFW